MNGVTNWLPDQQQPNIAGALMKGEQAGLGMQLGKQRLALGQQQEQSNALDMQAKNQELKNRNAATQAALSGDFQKFAELEPGLAEKYASSMKDLNDVQKQHVAATAQARFHGAAIALHSQNPVAAMRTYVASHQALFPNTKAADIKTLADAQHVYAESWYGAATTSEAAKQSSWSSPHVGMVDGKPAEFQTNAEGGVRVVNGVAPTPKEVNGTHVPKTVAQRLETLGSAYQKEFGPLSGYDPSKYGPPPSFHDYVAHVAPDVAQYVPSTQTTVQHHAIMPDTTVHTQGWENQTAPEQPAKNPSNKPYSGGSVTINGHKYTEEDLKYYAKKHKMSLPEYVKAISNQGS